MSVIKNCDDCYQKYRNTESRKDRITEERKRMFCATTLHPQVTDMIEKLQLDWCQKCNDWSNFRRQYFRILCQNYRSEKDNADQVKDQDQGDEDDYWQKRVCKPILHGRQALFEQLLLNRSYNRACVGHISRPIYPSRCRLNQYDKTVQNYNTNTEIQIVKYKYEMHRI